MYLFVCLYQSPERNFTIKMSALEIYNENVRDLLKPDSGPLRLLDDPEVIRYSETNFFYHNGKLNFEYVYLFYITERHCC